MESHTQVSIVSSSATPTRLPGINELLSRSITYMGQRFDVLLMLVISVFPILVFELATNESTAITISPVILLLALVLLFVFTPVASLVTYYITIRRPEPVSIWVGVSYVWRHFWSLSWVLLLVMVITCGVFCVTMLPFLLLAFVAGSLVLPLLGWIIAGFGVCLAIGLLLYTGILLSYTLPVYMQDGRRGLDAVTRSHELVTGKWWAILWRTSAFMSILTLLLSTVLGVLSVFIPPVIESVGGALLQVVTMMYLVVAIADTYHVQCVLRPVDTNRYPIIRRRYKFLAWMGAIVGPVAIIGGILALSWFLAQSFGA